MWVCGYVCSINRERGREKKREREREREKRDGEREIERERERERERKLLLSILVLYSSQINMSVPISPAVMCRMAAGDEASGHTGSAVAEVGGSG